MTGKNATEPRPQATTRWDRLSERFLISAEVSNIGIIITIVGLWFPVILKGCYGIFAGIAFVADPFIYFFKSLNRLTRAFARSVLKIPLEEEEYGLYRHKWQTPTDLLSATFFILAGCLLFGLMITNPIGITVGWIFGLTSMCISGWFEHHYQEKISRQRFEASAKHYAYAYEFENNDDPKCEKLLKLRNERDTLHKKHQIKKRSKQLFIALLIGLAFLLICSSAAAFAPPVVIPVLYVFSKIAAAYLVTIALGRAANFLFAKKYANELKQAAMSAEPPQTPIKFVPDDATPEPLEPSQSRSSSASIVSVLSPVAPEHKPSFRDQLTYAIKAYDDYKSKSGLGFFRTKMRSHESLHTLAILKKELNKGSESDSELKKAIGDYQKNPANIGKTLYDLLNNIDIVQPAQPQQSLGIASPAA